MNDRDKIRRIIADKHTGQRCRLNGQEAKVVGRLNDFATIATLGDTGLYSEWSWEAVDRIMSTTKEFHI